MLTGKPPHGPDVIPTVINSVLHSEPAQPSSLVSETPLDLSTICMKCLQKDPRDRYDSAAALADDLQRFLRGQPVFARPLPSHKRLWRIARRRPAISCLVVSAALLLLFALFGSTAAAWKFRADGRALGVLLSRAESAETKSRGELVRSSILQARMTRQSKREGQRRDALKIVDSTIRLLPNEDAIDPFRRDLRNEFVAALAVPEIDSEPWRPFIDWTKSEEATDAQLVNRVFGDHRVSLRPDRRSIRIDRRRSGESFPEPKIAVSEMTLLPMVALDHKGRWLAAIGHEPSSEGRSSISKPSEDPSRFLIIWDLNQASKPKALTELSNVSPVDVVINHHDQTIIVVGSNELTVFDKHGDLVKNLLAGGLVIGCCMHPTMPMIAVWDGCELRLVDLTESSPIQRTQSHATYEIIASQWHPDGSMLAIGSADHFAYTFYAGELDQPAMIFGGAQGWVSHVDFTADGTLMTSCRSEHRTRLYDTNSGREILTFEGIGVQYDASGNRIEGTKLGVPTRWTFRKPIANWTLEEDRNINVASNGDVDEMGRMVLCGWDNIFLWDMKTRRSLTRASIELPLDAKFIADRKILTIEHGFVRAFRINENKDFIRLEPTELRHRIPSGHWAEIVATRERPLVRRCQRKQSHSVRSARFQAGSQIKSLLSELQSCATKPRRKTRCRGFRVGK